MELHFEYYAKKEIPMVEVLKCPIKVNTTERKSLYFSISGRNKNWPETHPDYYFVMQELPQSSGKLAILMLTRHHSTYNAKREVRQLYVNPSVPKEFIRLRISKRRLADQYRLFGMDAERVYITSDHYLFLNYDLNTWDWIDQLIKYVDLLKRGLKHL